MNTPLDKTVALHDLDGQHKQKTLSHPCETSLASILNLDILVFKFHHTQCGMFVYRLILDTLDGTLNSR